MKYVNRKITVYSYTFGRPDIKTGAIHDMQTVERGHRMSKQALKDTGERLGGMVFLGVEEEIRLYRLPLEVFIQVGERVNPDDGDGDDENDTRESGEQDETGGNE